MADFNKELKIKVTFDGKEVKVGLSGVDNNLDKIHKTSKEVDNTWQAWSTGLNQAKYLLQDFMNILNQPITQAGQYEQFRTTLRVLLGDIKVADERFREMVQFASVTPFNVSGVIEAGNQLQALQKYSVENLRMLGDLAAAAGAPMEQALGAYAKLVSGQKGRAVEMFRYLLIATDDWAEATKKGFNSTGQIMASTMEMLEALPKIIQKKNFAGMMDEQSRTYVGRLSNMQDATEQLMGKIGDLFLEGTKENVVKITGFIGWVSDNLYEIKTIIENVGIAVASLFTIIKGGALLNYVFLNLATGTVAYNGIIATARVLTLKFFAVLSAHPFMAILSGITLVVSALRLYRGLTEQSAQQSLENAKATEILSRQQIKQVKVNKELAEEKLSLLNKYKDLTSSTDENTKSSEAYLSVIGRMKKEYPDVVDTTNEFDSATFNLSMEIDTVTGKISEYSNELKKLEQEHYNAIKSTKVFTQAVTREAMEKAIKSEGGLLSYINAFFEETIGTSTRQTKIETFLDSLLSPLRDTKNYEDAYKKFRDSQNKIYKFVEEKTISATLGNTLQQQIKNYYTQQLDIIDVVVHKQLDSNEEKLKKRFSELFVEAGEDNKKYAELLGKMQEELKKETSWDVNEFLGFSTKRVEQAGQLTFIKKSVTDELTRITAMVKEGLSELESKKKEAEKKRSDALKMYQEEVTRNQVLLDAGEKTKQEYSQTLSEILKKYDSYLKQYKEKSTAEISFRNDLVKKLKNDNKESLTIFNERFDMLSALEGSEEKLNKNRLDGYKNLLSNYQKWLSEFGTATIEEINILNKLQQKVNNYSQSFAKQTFDEKKTDLLKNLETEHRYRVANIKQIEDEDERKSALYNEEQRYLRNKLTILNQISALTGITPDDEAETQRKVREQINKDTQLEIAELQAEITELERDGAKDRENIWRDEWNKKIDIARSVLSQLDNLFGSIAEIGQQSADREADAYEKSKNRELDANYKLAIENARTQSQIQAINEEYARKQEELEEEVQKKRYERAKVWFDIQKAVKIANVISNIAEAITKDYSNYGAVGGSLMMGLNLAVQAAQLAVISSQEMPGYEKGGFTGIGGKKQVAGVVHKGEYVFDADTTMQYKPLFDLIYSLKGRKILPKIQTSYAEGGYALNDIRSIVGDIFRDYSSGSFSNISSSEVISELILIRREISLLAERPNKLVITRRDAEKIVSMGKGGLNKSRVN